ncbi:hypothetical protein EV426DRAFT_317063 [Tirmania nivea]|nr:hypothetical protein EV426DRAFT_317063 [Tirmania nivea]
MVDKTAFLDTSFPAKEHTKLRNSARNLIAQNPKAALPIFKSIAEYISQLHSQISNLQSSLAAAQSAAATVKNEESTSPVPIKKRKLDSDNDVDTNAQDTSSSSESAIANASPLATLPDLSFSVPQRKKFTLVLTASGVAATVPATGKVEWSVEWNKIKTICLLPVPEKAVRQMNFVIFPHGAEGVDPATSKLDAAVFTIPENAAPKVSSGPALPDSIHDAGSYQSLLTSLFNNHVPTSAKVVSPVKSEFQSAVPQPHRKGEPAFHVKAHRGTKEGYLWFLESGVVWGFKKPLMFIEFVRIDSVSYTSITKRTFNLNIHIHCGKDAGEDEEKGEEVEFAMIDQADYTGIDAYIRKHRLNDASMAEMRRGVVYNVNKPKGDNGDAEGGEVGIGGDGEPTVSDLQRALEQAEDEEEGEDYNPDEEGEDSEDDSEEDEEDDSEGSDEEEDEEEVGDLRDELGSELEVVEGGGDSDDEMGGVAKAVLARRSKGAR